MKTAEEWVYAVLAVLGRLGMRHTWLLVPYALGVAFASAFPLFLLLRARRLRAIA